MIAQPFIHCAGLVFRASQAVDLGGAGLARRLIAGPLEGAAGGAPGEVLAVGADGIRVATGAGVLVLTELQRAGGKRLPAADFLRGFPLNPGQLLAPSPQAEA